MKQTKIIMGMPVTVEIVDKDLDSTIFSTVFDYFKYIDKTFSPYKPKSEISKINRGVLRKENASADVQEMFRLSELTKRETDGFFDIDHNGKIDTSGIVKGWAIQKAVDIIQEHGYEHFYVDAGSDIQVQGLNANHAKWSVGIKNPFQVTEIVKVVYLQNQGIATSGAYIRGDHLYSPFGKIVGDAVASLTVIADSIYDADRFATAAYVMGESGIDFIESKEGLEGYMITKDGIATYTSGFEKYTHI